MALGVKNWTGPDFQTLLRIAFIYLFLAFIKVKPQLCLAKINWLIIYFVLYVTSTAASRILCTTAMQVISMTNAAGDEKEKQKQKDLRPSEELLGHLATEGDKVAQESSETAVSPLLLFLLQAFLELGAQARPSEQHRSAPDDIAKIQDRILAAEKAKRDLEESTECQFAEVRKQLGRLSTDAESGKHFLEEKMEKVQELAQAAVKQRALMQQQVDEAKVQTKTIEATMAKVDGSVVLMQQFMKDQFKWMGLGSESSSQSAGNILGQKPEIKKGPSDVDDGS